MYYLYQGPLMCLQLKGLHAVGATEEGPPSVGLGQAWAN